MPLFGANYPDAICVDGYMCDADAGECVGDGVIYPQSDYPCPVCNTDAWIEYVGVGEDDDCMFKTREDALAYVEKLKEKYKDDIYPDYR